MPDKNQIVKLVKERTKLIDLIIERMENEVGRAQNALMRDIAEDYVEGFDVDEAGNIKNTLANKRKLAMLDRVFAQFYNQSGLQIVKAITQGVQDVFKFNGKYYGTFTTQAKLGGIMAQTTEFVNDWMGITKRGALVENGYLQIS